MSTAVRRKPAVRVRVRATLLMIMMSAVLLTAALLAPAQAMTGVPFGQIVATHSGKCIAVTGGATNSGAPLSQAACMGATSETWELQPGKSGYFRLIGQASHACIALQPGSNKQLVLAPCNTSLYEEWAVTAQPAGGYTLVALKGGNCMDVLAQGQADGAVLQRAPCTGAANQLFQFEQTAFVGAVPVAIVSQLSGQCIAVQNGSGAPLANTVQYPCGTEPNDTWTLHPVKPGLVQVVNIGSGLCLDVAAAGTAPGTPIDQNTCAAGATNQLWQLRVLGNFWGLEAQNSHLCVSAAGGALGAGTQLVQTRCTVAAVDQWSLHVPTPPAVWTAPVTEGSIAVAAANLPDGRVLTWAADQPDAFGETEQTYTELLDPVAGTDAQTLVTNTLYNMFCPGIANLPDGTILVNGGDTNTVTALYSPATNSWSTQAPMNVGRGYQGSAMMPDGSVFTLGGSWSANPLGVTPGEIWHAATGWTLLPNIASTPIWTADQAGPYRADNHLWLHILSGGRLLHAGPSATMHWIDPNGGGGLGSIVSAGPRGADGDSMNGNASAYDVDKLLKVGGAPNYDGSYATPNAVLIDGSGSGNPVVTPLAPMNYARGFGNSVVLPNGQVAVIGGQTYDSPFTDLNAVLAPEIWDPTTQVFTVLAPMATPRTYHSTALLLPDGRVWVSGGGLCGTGCGNNGANHLTYEILTPPYLLTASGAPAVRPVITGVGSATLALGGTLTITTASPVKSFSLMRLSSVTHTVNNDQRRIPLLATTVDGANYSATLSADSGILLPGYYMLFALNAVGVPSLAVTVQIL